MVQIYIIVENMCWQKQENCPFPETHGKKKKIYMEKFQEKRGEGVW